MASFNLVVLIGNLVADPELKTTSTGISVTSFRIAVSRRYNAGEQQQADFINIVCWRKT
ncbi:MAG: single-stranded DNA-binding protein, partial [Clostridia bacterium]|nr:single-stranded DNA-binding protein [Clostridia bacterium]